MSVTKKPSTPHTFTAEKKRQFLDLYSAGGTVEDAARAVGISKVTIFKHKRSDEEFAAAFNAAMDVNTDILEDHLLQMATQKLVPGNVAALFGTLKSRRPEKWRDSYKVEHAGKVELVTAEALAAARMRAKARA